MPLYHQTFEDEIVTIDWISNNIQKYGLTRKDLMNDLGLSKTVLSLYLSGKRNLTKMGKATFYYYFLAFEFSRAQN